MNIKEIINEIDDWNYLCPEYTWSSLLNFVGPYKNRFNVINLGKQGIGKTHSTVNLAKFLALPHIVWLEGNYTPKKFYQTLLKHRDKTIILDEASVALRDKNLSAIIRSAMSTGEIGWHSSVGEDSSAHFDGSLIFNTNSLTGKSADVIADRDRCFINNIELTNKEISMKIEQKNNWKPNRAVWKLIRNRILAIQDMDVDKSGHRFSLALEKQEAGFVNTFVQQSIERLGLQTHPEISTRIYDKTEEIFCRMKGLFGTLNVDSLAVAESLASNYVVTTTVPSRLGEFSNLLADHAMEQAELINLYARRKNYGMEHSRRIVEKAIRDGILLKTGEEVCVG